MQGFEKYPSYRDSGVKWFREVPLNWQVAKAKHILRKLERPRIKNGNTVVCSNHGYSKLLGDTKVGLVSLTQHDYQGVNDGDLLVHGMDAWHGAITISKHTGDCTSVVHVCDTEYDKAYIAYFLKMLAIMNVYKVISNGVRQNTSDFRSWQKFGEVQLLLPTKLEQTAIAKFLDEKTEKIDQSIAQKEQLIALLKERKQILIQQAVTKGLNPDAPLKDSGIDWIGEIPAHWEVKNFRYLIDVLTDYTANGSFGDLAKNVSYLDEPSFSRLIRLTDLRKGLKNKGVYLSEKSHKYLKKSELYGGELLMANVGAYAGLAWLMPNYETPCSLAPNMFLIKPKSEIVSVSYLECLLNSEKYWGFISNVAQAAAQPKLNKENIRQIRLIIPPKVEQKKILDYVSSTSTKIDESISLQERQIEQLKEYKSVLIDSAVTGKIKVV